MLTNLADHSGEDDHGFTGGGAYYAPREEQVASESGSQLYGGHQEQAGQSRLDPYDMAGKHPVMMLHEYCAKKKLQLSIVVPEEVTDLG